MSAGWPALTVALPVSTGWRLGIAALAALAALSLAAWWWRVHDALPGWLQLAGLALGGLAIVSVWTLRGAPGTGLRWDGRQWWLVRTAAAPIAGRLTVALDVGAWMLLRFDASAPPARHWIAAGRAGMAGDWHAMRCAVYCARPAPGGSSADAPPASDE